MKPSELEIVYEDNHLIAISKPAGLLVHGDETGDTSLEELVKQYIKKKYNKPGDVWLGVLHRIDRPSSGTVIFARTSKAAERMNKLMQQRAIRKIYYVIVESRPEEVSARLHHWLQKNAENNTVRAFDKPKGDAKEAILEYEVVGEIDEKCLLRVELMTGRPHQIRAQLKKINCTILGDLKYGSKTALPDKSICLHCHSMQFEHPVQKNLLTISSGVPKTLAWRELGDLVESDIREFLQM